MNGKNSWGAFLIPAALLLLIGFGLWFLYIREPEPTKKFESSLKLTLAETPIPETKGAALNEAVLRRMEYTVFSKEKNRVRIRVEAPDMGTLIHSEEQNLLLRKGNAEELISLLEAGAYTTRVWELDVELDEDGDPLDPLPLYDAMYGGLITEAETVMDDFFRNAG